jgi:hypothetical protein
MIAMRKAPLIILVFQSVILSAQRLLPLGEGITGTVNAMVVHEDLLVVAGSFSTFDGHFRRNIQAWDGVAHFDMPGAFEQENEQVNSLLIHAGHLIAGGREEGFQHVARWNGSVWEMMGTGLPGHVDALASLGDTLCAAVGGQVFIWWNDQWQMLAGPFNGPIRTLAVWNGILFAGGSFTANTGSPIAHLARWSNGAWQQVGGGLNGPVHGSRTHGDGLYVSGSFTGTADGTQELAIWCRYTNGEGYEQLPVLPAMTPGRIGSFNGMDLVLMGDVGAWYRSGDMEKVLPFTNARYVIEYAGHKYIAGSGVGLTFAHTLPGICRVDLRRNNWSEVDIADVRATIYPRPMLFRARREPGAVFEVPAGEGMRTLRWTMPMLRGEMDGVKYYSSERQLPLGDDDPRPWAGPRASSMDPDFYERYHQVWKLERAQVAEHLQDWAMPGYSAPAAILEWPAHGDPMNGEPDPLAPFNDLNGNGTYEPGQGEFPLMKGDQAIYHITHSTGHPGLPHLPVEMQFMTHAFEDPQPFLRNTIFLSLKLVNRTDQTFENTRFGLFTSFAIGCPDDDFAGCDPSRDLYFAYNWNDLDTDCDGILGYGASPPAQGVKFLNMPLLSHRTSGHSVPVPLDDLFDGTQDGGTLANGTTFQFPGDGDSELAPTPATPGRSSMGATGPFTFAPGDTICLDVAFIYGRAASGGAVQSVEVLKLRADSVQAFYDELSVACNEYSPITSIGQTRGDSFLRIFPNPAQAQITVEAASPIRHLRILDAQGREVRTMHGTSDRMTIGVSDLPAGLYLVQAWNEQGVHAMRLVVE